ncbi:DNA-binding response regulator [Rhodoferax koreense]|uniref:DNA-binding response regulator n=2 Tax=Rhodoferax koreensis TaxID=1842727 RepID=A0A1P8K350_9BURK|nr:DNA-binding response regulator [Rhodoferax koreense]
MPHTPNGPSNAAPAPRIRVMVADDQALIRRGMTLMLSMEPDIEVVGEAADGIEAVVQAARLQPDVVLMDLNMPRQGGVAATREITLARPATQVLVLTTFDTDDLVFEAVRAGARAYLLKDAGEAEVLDAVRALHRGESRLTPLIARKLLDQFQQLADAAGPRNAPLPNTPVEPSDAALNDKEENILRLIAAGKTNRQIAETVFLAEGTVKNYVSRIMEKLHAATRTELAVIALRQRR